MRIKLAPDANFPYELVLSKVGDVLTINGESFDFSPMGSGDSLPIAAIDSPWFRGDYVDKELSGELVVTIALPNFANASYEQRFPVDIVDPPDGVIALPQPLEQALEDLPNE